MTIYALLDDTNTIVMEYPLTIFQVREELAPVSVPNNPSAVQLAPYHVVIVKEISPPISKGGRVVVELTPQQINGVWTQVWVQVKP